MTVAKTLDPVFNAILNQREEEEQGRRMELHRAMISAQEPPKIKIVEDDRPYNFNLIAEDIQDKYHVLSFKKNLFRYQDGIYIADEGFLDSCIVNDLLKRGIKEDGRITTAAAQVRHYLTFGKVETEYPFNVATDAIPVKNGIIKIDLATGKTTLLPFSPKYRFNYKLRVSYDAAADGTPIKGYLDSLGTDTDLLLQIPAHAILGMLGRVYKKAYFLKGSKNSGKSTYIDLLVRHLFGIDVCSAISLQSLLYDRFRLAELDGKIVNAYADLSDQKLRDIGLFKALTGGDEVTIEKKHRDPYKLRNKALLLFSANKYPKIDAGDEAFWDRWVSLEFSKSFPVDPTFEDRIFTEMNISGFLNLVLTKMQEIIRNGINVTDSVETKWLNDASSCHRFIQDALEKSLGAVLVKADCYKKYVEYCQAGDYEIEAQRSLTDAMLRTGALSRQLNVKGKASHCYQGYKAKGAPPVYSDTETGRDAQVKVTA
jgi:P4 family phage/plasmid primase-like protien